MIDTHYDLTEKEADEHDSDNDSGEYSIEEGEGGVEELHNID